jgi:hypothetical protein
MKALLSEFIIELNDIHQASVIAFCVYLIGCIVLIFTDPKNPFIKQPRRMIVSHIITFLLILFAPFSYAFFFFFGVTIMRCE